MNKMKKTLPMALTSRGRHVKGERECIKDISSKENYGDNNEQPEIIIQEGDTGIKNEFVT